MSFAVVVVDLVAVAAWSAMEVTCCEAETSVGLPSAFAAMFFISCRAGIMNCVFI